MFAFMCSMGLWKTHSVIGTKASGLSLIKLRWLSQHDLPTTLHTLEQAFWNIARSIGRSRLKLLNADFPGIREEHCYYGSFAGSLSGVGPGLEAPSSAAFNS